MALNHLCLPIFHSKTAVLPNVPYLQNGLSPGNFTSHHVRSVTKQVSQPATANQRRSANYKPTIWSYEFLESLKNDQADNTHKERAEKLEQELRRVINDRDAEPLALLEIIDDIQRLGLGHRFENDIRSAIDKVASLQERKNIVIEDNSLHLAALRFRLLRQHGYQVSQDVFSYFMAQGIGRFKESLSEDVKALLSLYEASYFAYEGEDVLEEAKAFARMHLNGIQVKISRSLAEQVNHALELPFHRRMRRLEARQSIEMYSLREDANQVLLELAMLDFNAVQSVHQRELRDIIKWWRATGLSSKLSFARDRLMECFFWAVGMVPEPQYGDCRKGLTKVVAFITILDDVYDIYGTLEELELLTDAVERWDITVVNDLPYYMKLYFLALYNNINEMAYDILKEQGEMVIPYLAKTWADLCKAFLQEAKWSFDKHIPSFDEYLENAWMSSSGPLLLVHTYFLFGQNKAKQEELEYIEDYGGPLRWPSLVFRLCNDVATSRAELVRGDVANGIPCYMQETSQSEELARKHVNGLIEEAWKWMNKDGMDGAPFKKPFRETVFDLARIAHCQYQYGDGHGCPDARNKSRVTSLLIEPFLLMENRP